jgi:hypothetical protein
MQGHLWEDNRAVVEWLSSQLDENNTKSVVLENLKCLCRDKVLNQANKLIEVSSVKRMSLRFKGPGSTVTSFFYRNTLS